MPTLKISENYYSKNVKSKNTSNSSGNVEIKKKKKSIAINCVGWVIDKNNGTVWTRYSYYSFYVSYAQSKGYYYRLWSQGKEKKIK